MQLSVETRGVRFPMICLMCVLGIEPGSEEERLLHECEDLGSNLRNPKKLDAI